MPPLQILVTIAAGPTYRFSTAPLILTDSRTGQTYQYAAVLGEMDPPSVGDLAADSFECSLPWSAFSANGTRYALRDGGICLGGAEAEVAVVQDGASRIEDRTILMTGMVVPNSERHYPDHVEFSISSAQSKFDRPFPPHVLQARSFGEAAIPTSSQGQAVAIPYGLCTEVPLLPLQDLQSPPNSTNLPTSVRFVVAGCRIGSSRVKIRYNGDATLYTYRDVLYGADPAGGEGQVAYCLIERSEAQGYSTFVGELQGKMGAGGVPISGLGDVILDVIRTYGQVPENRIDWARFNRFLPHANGIAVSSIFAGQGGGTAISTLQSRYGSFPIEISWRNGLLGADWLPFDPFAPLSRTFVMGEDLLDRLDPVEVVGDELPYSEYRFNYDYNVQGQQLRKTLVVNWQDSEACRDVYSRFGRVPFPDQNVYDIASVRSMRALADAFIDLNSTQRRRIAYMMPWETLSNLPIHDRFGITDTDMGWSAEPFRLEAVQPLRSGRCIATFRSFRDARLV